MEFFSAKLVLFVSCELDLATRDQVTFILRALKYTDVYFPRKKAVNF